MPDRVVQEQCVSRLHVVCKFLLGPAVPDAQPSPLERVVRRQREDHRAVDIRAVDVLLELVFLLDGAVARDEGVHHVHLHGGQRVDAAVPPREGLGASVHRGRHALDHGLVGHDLGLPVVHDDQVARYPPLVAVPRVPPVVQGLLDVGVPHSREQGLQLRGRDRLLRQLVPQGRPGRRARNAVCGRAVQQLQEPGRVHQHRLLRRGAGVDIDALHPKVLGEIGQAELVLGLVRDDVQHRLAPLAHLRQQLLSAAARDRGASAANSGVPAARGVAAARGVGLPAIGGGGGLPVAEEPRVPGNAERDAT
mmetsp:Transcript_68824/g.193018  ORF Transcript_68824/g.193018 Transcript_68824/m.193018 type:complete len:307 (-) Transcript_68824:71-991(-)